MNGSLTILEQRILFALHQNATPMSSAEVGQALRISTRSAINVLQYLRGRGMINDGSVIYGHPGSETGCVHRPSGLIRWSLGPAKTVQGPCPDSVLNERKA